MLARAAELLTADRYADGAPAPHTLEGKAVLILTKLTKWARRQASAQHHLAAVLTALQRPGSPEMKRGLVELVEERVEEYRALEDAVLEALEEAGEGAD